MKNDCSGSIITLTGPAVKQHIRQQKQLLSKTSRLIIVEHDSELIKSEDYYGQIKSFKDNRIWLVSGDLWDLINLEIKRANKNKSRKYSKSVVLFDFDFCCTALKLLETDFASKLKNLVSSNLPKKEKFWLSITTSGRHGLSATHIDLFHLIQKTIHNEKWHIHGCEIPYRNKNKSSMLTMVFTCRKIPKNKLKYFKAKM